jgi:glycosyltransferase involved in cell wall biosynthesis
MSFFFPVSCVVPVYNERNTILALVESFNKQTVFPSEVIIVDGGSTDDTVQFLRQQLKNDNRFRIIEAGRAMPGKGRNIGAELVTTEWIAFTDAGIKLDSLWLENLINKTKTHPNVAIVYGNFSPVTETLFEKCATISYVPPLRSGSIRTKSIVSCLLKKEVWEKAGGFPDWRATEDLVFMEKIEKLNYPIAFAPDAMVFWQLRPNLGATFKKFELYSKYNVWAGRQAFWHYGILRQYALMALAILLAVLLSWYWLLLIPVWICARVAKRIYSHRQEFGVKTLFNPAVFFMVVVITLVIDAATFSGWLKALFQKKNYSKFSLQ